MTQWDFAADLDAVLDRSARGEGPRSMSDMIKAANAVVAGTDAGVLQQWMTDNAQTLVGQQILVTSVHAQVSAATELPRLLAVWAASAALPSAASALEWFKEEHPALLRAWLLSKIEVLLEDELNAL